MARSAKQILGRVQEVAAQISRFGPMLVGTLTKRPNRKDGSEYVSIAYSTFQYKGADGKRKWKRIPCGAETRVKKTDCDRRAVSGTGAGIPGVGFRGSQSG